MISGPRKNAPLHALRCQGVWDSVYYLVTLVMAGGWNRLISTKPLYLSPSLGVSYGLWLWTMYWLSCLGVWDFIWFWLSVGQDLVLPVFYVSNGRLWYGGHGDYCR